MLTFIIFSLLGASLAILHTEDEANPTVQVWCDEKVLNLIVNKLEDLNKKVDIMDTKLTAMTMEKPNSKLSLEELVASKVKDFHTQMTLEMVSQTVSAIKQNQQDISAQLKGLNETIIDQRDDQKIHSEALKHVIEDWKTESTKVTDDTLKKVQLALATEKLSNEDLHSSITRTYDKVLLLKNDLNDIKTATQRNSEEPVWNKKNFESLNANIAVNKQQISALHSKFNNDLHNRLEIQYTLELKILKYLQENIPKIFPLSKQDLNRELAAIQTTMNTFNGTVNTLSDFLMPSYSNCVSALESTAMSGVYRLFIPHMGLMPFDTYCLEDQMNGSHWTIIQRRQNGSVDFYRDWQDYKHGFGNPKGEYWLGLEKIYAMTSKQPHELWIELGDWEGQKRSARYSLFEIGNEKERYYLKTVGKYSGTAGDSLGFANKTRKFTTRDADNDEDNTRNCAIRFRGAWWYNNCNWSDLNAQYNNTQNGQGINWYQWHGFTYSLKYAHLAIRPVK